MPHIEASAVVATAPEALFKKVDFFGDSAWIPGTAQVTFAGGVRTVTTVDGVKIVERLDFFDRAQRTFRYAIIEAPMPASNYVSTVSITPEGDGSRVRWVADFDAAPDMHEALTQALQGLFDSAVSGLKEGET
jgi:hypothetical protein